MRKEVTAEPMKSTSRRLLDRPPTLRGPYLYKKDQGDDPKCPGLGYKHNRCTRERPRTQSLGKVCQCDRRRSSHVVSPDLHNLTTYGFRGSDSYESTDIAKLRAVSDKMYWPWHTVRSYALLHTPILIPHVKYIYPSAKWTLDFNIVSTTALPSMTSPLWSLSLSGTPLMPARRAFVSKSVNQTINMSP